MTAEPWFELTYDGTDISEEIRPFTAGISYTDNLEGTADDLKIVVENRDLRWLDAWLPEEGAKLALKLGYKGAELLGPIQFEIDDPEFSGSPDRLSLGATACPVTASLRERRTQAYENTDLPTIAQTIATRHNLELIGDLPDIEFKRITQKEQTDLEFLRKLGEDYGVAFKIESASRLVFFRLESLEQASPVLAICRSPDQAAQDAAEATESKTLVHPSDYRILRRAAGTYTAAQVSYQDPEKGEFTEITIDLNGVEVPKPKEEEEGEVVGDTTLRIRERVESVAQAKIRAVEALKRANRSRVEARFSMAGNVLLNAGITVTVIGYGRFDGKYLINKAEHRIDSSNGYLSSIEAEKIVTE